MKSTGKLCASVMFLFGIIGAGVSYAPAPVRAMLPVVVQQMLFVLTMLSIGGVFVGFFMGMLSALAYNILAKLNGGIVLELKGGSLRHVGVFSMGSFCAIPLLLIGLVPAGLYGPIGTIIGPLIGFGDASGSMGLSAVAMFPFGFAVGGFLIGGLTALLSNLAFRFSGGLPLGLDPPPAAPPAPAKKPPQKQAHELKSSKKKPQKEQQKKPQKKAVKKGPPRPPPKVVTGLLAKSRRIGNMPYPTVKDPSSFSGKVLMVVRPQEPLSPNEVKTIVFNVESGMGLLLVGDGGEDNSNLNSLAKRFGAAFNSDLVSSIDEEGSASYTPFLYAMPHTITDGLEAFQVDRSCSLLLNDWNSQVLLFSSENSFSDADGSMTWDEGEYAGSCAVMARAEVGQGRVVFIGDAIMFERTSPTDLKLLDRMFKWLWHEL